MHAHLVIPPHYNRTTYKIPRNMGWYTSCRFVHNNGLPTLLVQAIQDIMQQAIIQLNGLCQISLDYYCYYCLPHRYPVAAAKLLQQESIIIHIFWDVTEGGRVCKGDRLLGQIESPSTTTCGLKWNNNNALYNRSARWKHHLAHHLARVVPCGSHPSKCSRINES